MSENPMTDSDMISDRAEGILFGLACGDALGRPVEFKSQQQIEAMHGRLTEMLGDGTHGKPAGTITDDTEMALCIARGLAENGGFDPADVASRFVEWYESGPFDIGLMTSESLRRIRDGESWETAGTQVWKSRAEGSNAGNGSVMRCSPYAIAFADQPEELVEVSLASSSITHADPRCTYGCAILNRTLAGLLMGEENPLEMALDELQSDAPAELVDALRAVPYAVHPDELQSSGYVIHTLQSALYHGLTAKTAKDGICDAVNMGKDTDTVGAVTGAIVGARFGSDALPESWIQTLSTEDSLRELAVELISMDELESI
jgi:ADP-ribosyl-[dinitrogen reductase] hydrolase